METDADSFVPSVKLEQDTRQGSGGVGSPHDLRFEPRLDQTAFTFGSPSDQLFNPELFDFPGPSTGDAFGGYPSFSDLMNEGTNTGANTAPVGDSLKLEATSPPFYGDPFLFNSPSPGQFFTSDFDVSYDMRSSSGQESVLPLLPQDMEAWRTILQDSRFFGITGESSESDKDTPR